ncbi:MAG TPA: MBOAT family O-acyltransferase [Anaerolineales bacterium]|nr:MBOAT family O-acyltransferase [Anaerolineales bacterium]
MGVLLILAILFFQKWMNAYDGGGSGLLGNAVPLSIFPILGLSYVSFQVISYLVDVSRNGNSTELNFVNYAAYLLFFPKLVSGPLVKYKQFKDQLSNLSFDMDGVAAGLRRILSGVVKRLLVANPLGVVADSVFNLPTANVAPHFAWLGLIAYTLQIFFDFSGYTDIAIGLAKIMGINLPENFNFPYIAQSVGEFWRRWHMTLSGWFREYVFFPLERNRTRLNNQQVNIFIVFLLTGLWHGLTLNFIVWGALHGIMIALESLGGGRWQKQIWRPFRHLITMAIVMLGWVFFRSTNLGYAMEFIGRLAGNTNGLTTLPFSLTRPLPFIEPSFVITLVFAVIFSLPIGQIWQKIRSGFESRVLIFQFVEDIMLLSLFLLAIGSYLSGSFKPNIYAAF